jgi:hypothetical protein
MRRDYPRASHFVGKSTHENPHQTRFKALVPQRQQDSARASQAPCARTAWLDNAFSLSPDHRDGVDAL